MKTLNMKGYAEYRRMGYPAARAWEKCQKVNPFSGPFHAGRKCAWWMGARDKIGRTPKTNTIHLPKDHPMIRGIYEARSGWYADDFQDETYTGAAFQMAGRWRKDSGDALYFPGYVERNTGYAVIDLSWPFAGGQDMFGDDYERAKCIRAGDDMARTSAEEAREYDEAGQAGLRAGETARKIVERRRQVRALRQVPPSEEISGLIMELGEQIEEMENAVRDAVEDVAAWAEEAFRDGFLSECPRESATEWLGEEEEKAA